MSTRKDFDDNMHKLATKTSVHLGRFGLLNPDGSVHRGGFESLDNAELQRLFEEHHILHQENFSDELYVNNSVQLLGDSIGRGTSGIAFRCLFKGREYVIKIPITMWKERMLYKDGRNFLIRNLNGDNRDRYNELRRRSDHSFRGECLFNEMAIDSRFHREIRGGEPGSRLPRTNYRGYLNLRNELNLMKSHEGYEHIHKIVGFVSGLPIIFSEPCTGSLSSIIKAGPDKSILDIDASTKKLSNGWLELAGQIGSAIRYLKEVANLVHMDIKPDNILFIERVDESMQSAINWKLCDFGICKAMNADETYTTKFMGGSDKYLPKIVKGTKYNGGLFDAYECSLYSYMLTMLVSIKFNLPNGGYLFSRGIHFRASHPDNADIIDYVNADREILGLLSEAFEYGTGGLEILSSDRDSVFDMLSKMFFSGMSDKPIFFENLMGEIKNELNTRALIRSRSLLVNSKRVEPSHRPQIQEISNDRYRSFSPSIEGYRDLIRPLTDDEEHMVRATRRRI